MRSADLERRKANAFLPASLGLAIAVYVTDAATRWTGPTLHTALRDWFTVALYAGGAALCIWRGVRVEVDRVAWFLPGAGIAAYGCGSLVFVLGHGMSAADATIVSEALWVAFYPAAIATVLLLAASRAPRFPLGAWLDAAAAALSLAALLAAVALPGIPDSLSQPGTLAVGAGFPAAYIVLVTLTLWVLSLTRWRAHASWVLMTLAFLLLSVGDTLLAIRAVDEVYVRGELTSVCFPLAMVVGERRAGWRDQISIDNLSRCSFARRSMGPWLAR